MSGEVREHSQNLNHTIHPTAGRQVSTKLWASPSLHPGANSFYPIYLSHVYKLLEHSMIVDFDIM